MKKLSLILLIGLCACTADPEALRYGTDACHTCKMTLMDKKFGGELVTAKGKVYKFDDLNCLAAFLNSDYLSNETIVHTLVIDYAHPEMLIPAERAWYLMSDAIRSPMASGISAFATREAMQPVQAEVNGTELTWSEVLAKFE